MDPNANLTEQLAIAKRILRRDDDEDALRLAELVQALDETSAAISCTSG